MSDPFHAFAKASHTPWASSRVNPDSSDTNSTYPSYKAFRIESYAAVGPTAKTFAAVASHSRGSNQNQNPDEGNDFPCSFASALASATTLS
eukprot:31547-Pelagococcus_subviridis.AAC.13